MNSNDFQALNFKDINNVEELFPQNRRDFLRRLGGGIVILVAFCDVAAAQEQARPGAGRQALPTDFNAFLRIDENGQITCFTGKIEMGQGIITSLAMMLGEELNVPLYMIRMLMGDTDLCPWDMGTFGSMTTRFFGPPLRAAGAEAREVLLELGAEALKLPKSRVATRNGSVYDTQNPRTNVPFGQLTKGQKITRFLKTKPALKSPADFRFMGKSENRSDAQDKLTGAALYSGDIRVPGMLYARILTPPAHGARLKKADTAAIKDVPGAQVVQQEDLVAVLHELPDMADKALAKIKAEYDIPTPEVNDKNIFEHLVKVAPGPQVVASGGDLEQGRKLASKKFETTFFDSYVAHAAMETHTALARVEGEKAIVWASTQNPFGARGEIAQALGFPVENVRVITPFVGGGFGGKTFNLQAVQAARLAKAVNKPVQVMWTRAQEFFYDTFRPAAVVKINSGMDDAGRMAFWDYEVYWAGERGSQQFYTVPHHRTAARGSGWGGAKGVHPFGTGAWRAPGNNTNTFARESQIDIMAAAAGIDPVTFRLRNLKDERMIRVLQTAADSFGWFAAKAPSKRGFGVACGTDAGTYVAAIAHVEVDPQSGAVRVHRVVCAQDMGIVVNPQGATIQMEGCITMGLGYALTEEVHFNGGQVQDTNFDTYDIPRFSWTPRIEVALLDVKDMDPQGGGEPAIILMGAVIANAIYDATGARLFRLPMTPERVKAALAKI